MKKIKAHIYFFTGLLCLSSANSFAAGFATGVPTAASAGNSYAGQVTGVHNIGDMFVKPAILMEFDRHQVLSDGNIILPSFKLKSGAQATTFDNQPIDLSGNGNAGLDFADPALIPTFYAMRVLNDNARLGLSITVPWGLSTDYENGWIGRYYALDSEIESLNIAPVFAYQISPRLSLGGGLQLQYFKASLSRAVDFSSAYRARPDSDSEFSQPSAETDIRTELEGDDWQLGYKLGLLYQVTDKVKLGLSFRSKMAHSLSGENNFIIPEALVSTATAGGAFVDSDIETDMTTPEAVDIGLSYRINDQYELLFEGEWNRWSRLDQIVIHHANPAQPDDINIYDWKNNWYWAVGLNYYRSQKLTLRTGVLYEDSPIPDSTRSPSLPTPDKLILSLGASYHLSERSTLDISYVHIDMDDAKTDLTVAESSNFFRGNLSAAYELAIDIIAVGFNHRF